MTDSQAVTSPGPWTVDAQSSLPRIVSADRVIAAVFSGNGPGSSRDVALKDAQLLAAAPTLLVTLKEIVAHLRSITLDPGDDEDDAPALMAADALIAKAEGRAES